MSRVRPALILILAAALPLAAWGPEGHRMLAAAALPDLPPGVARWFAGQEAVLPQHANDPDHWKRADPLEAPRHFLDSETYGGPAAVPRDEDAARAALGPELFQVAGQVPWTVQARVELLAQAFTAGVPLQVALHASWLSHYVGDLNVPLHTTVDHDGETTGQRGIHVRWEDTLLARVVAAEHWRPEVRPAELGPDPGAAVWDWLAQSFALVADVLADDRLAQDASARAGEPPFGPVYWQDYMVLQGPVVKEQLTVAAQRTAQMILLAWTLAGSPEPPRSNE